MSSWDRQAKAGNRVHKERQQPEARRKLGFLEHKKDYKRRARDFQSKSNVIKKLRRKALDKNPDEFYFHMLNSQVLDGIHHDKDKDADESTPAQKKLMRTQDLQYVTHKWVAERNKVDRLTSTLHFPDLEASTCRSHIIFEEDTDGDVIAIEKPKSETLRKIDGEDPLQRRIERHRQKAYKELEQRQQRERELRATRDKLIMRKRLAEGGEPPRRISKGTNAQAPVYKWEYVRKK